MKALRSIMSLFTIAAFAVSVLAATPSVMTSSKPVMKSSTHGDIVAVISSDKNLSTLSKAIKIAGLDSELKGHGPYTVFAPSNYAFSKLPKGTLDSLMKPQNKMKLRSLLLDHVVRGSISAANVMKMTSPVTLTSLGGAKITVKHAAKTVMVDNGQVTSADIKASNGIVHVVSAVLVPPTSKSSMSR